MKDLKEDKIKRNGLYYLEKDGKQYTLPSVTTIIGNAMPKPQLLYWAARISARAALQDPSITEEQAISAISIAKKDGAVRGSLIHSFAEASDNGNTMDIGRLMPEMRPYAYSHQKFVNDYSPKLIQNEMIVANFTEKYAGQLDRIYDIKGKIAIVDFKTSANYYSEMGLQLVAYRNAEFVFNKYTKEWSSMPKVDQTFIVLLGEDGTYTVKETDEPLAPFLSLKEIYLWLNKDKLEKVKINKNAKKKEELINES